MPRDRLIRNASHCQRDGCTTWSLEPEEHGFLDVLWPPAHLIFCSPDCLITHMATTTTPKEEF